MKTRLYLQLFNESALREKAVDYFKFIKVSEKCRNSREIKKQKI